MKLSTVAYVGSRILACKLFGRRYPLAMAFELTHDCNMSCPHCYTSDDVTPLGREDHFRILREINAAGCRIVSFTGGEPLLVPYLTELMTEARKMGMWVQCTTNGVALPDREQEMMRAGADMIQLSLDGNQDAHEKARGDGSFTRIIDALDVVKRNDWRCLIVSVIHKYTTLESLAFVLSKALEAGAFVSFQPLCDLPALEPTRDRLVESLDFLRMVRKTRKKEQFVGVLKQCGAGSVVEQAFAAGRRFYNPMDQPMVMLKYLYRFPSIGYLPCTAGRLFGRIRPDGQLVPCYYAIDRENPLNIISDGFEKAWKNINLPECRNCWHHHRLELNLIYSLSISTIINVLYYHLNKKYYKRDE